MPTEAAQNRKVGHFYEGWMGHVTNVSGSHVKPHLSLETLVVPGC